MPGEKPQEQWWFICIKHLTVKQTSWHLLTSGQKSPSKKSVDTNVESDPTIVFIIVCNLIEINSISWGSKHYTCQKVFGGSGP